MPRLICHRGFWWPHHRQQNHPAALNAALERGWDVEVDVWRAHGQRLEVGHDRPNYEWTLPSPEIGPGRLFLHLKGSSVDGYPRPVDVEERIREVVERAGWGTRAVQFVSPPVRIGGTGMPCLAIAQERLDLDVIPVEVSGLWIEQGESDWLTVRDIEAFQDDFPNHTVPLYVLSSELHGRQVHLDRLMQWKEADGIVTDMPHLYEQIFDNNNATVHPQGAWW